MVEDLCPNGRWKGRKRRSSDGIIERTQNNYLGSSPSRGIKDH